MALERWLHREFMLFRHDKAGRKDYQQLMDENEMVPYMEDIFKLDWLTWWINQKKNGYYEAPVFKNFEKMLKVDRNIIKEAASRQVWNDMQGEEEESNAVLLMSYLCSILQFSLLTAPSASEMLEDPTLPSSGSVILGGTRADAETVFAFKCLSHAPPDLPHKDDGDLDWESILNDLVSLGTSLNMQEPRIEEFLHQFDQVRLLDKNTVNGYPALWKMLQELCGVIRNTVDNTSADLMKYLEKKLSLDEDEAGKDIDTLLSWLQQFTV
ncbi:hypothetical protein L210DRAFT_3647367 [Boletus edulis BED1]|uniref:Uncharacterized protein n=1 Tax=Boletus edulis BED1 TaxID=1328754 RepID=A0AAD4BR61_BOLED|nr:hypothetical protein L210DRAFT_3647367 [Boletus edulis BED1]